MAQVSFTIAAIDKTRAAFASINQRLNQLVKGGDAAQKKLLGLGLRFAGIGSVVALVGGQVRKVARDIESVPGVSHETIDSWQRMHVRVSQAGGAIQNITAWAGQAADSLIGLARFGAMAAVHGVDVAQMDLLENERQLAEQYKISTGYYDRLREATDKLTKARLDLKHVGESEGQSITRRRQEADLLEKRALAMTDEIKRTDKLAESVNLRTAAERDYQKLLAEHTKLTREAGAANSEMMGMTVPLKERIEGLRAAWARTSYELAQYTDKSPEGLEKQNQLLAEQARIAKALGKAYEEQNRLANEAGAVLARGFEDAAFEADNLRDVVNGLINDLARLVFRDLITNPLASSISGGIKSFFDGFRAAGGPVSASSSYIVGENGPELFTPSQAGRIIPNHQMSSAGGSESGVTVNQSFSFATGVTRQEVAALIPQIVEASRSAVFDAVRRGGSARRVFA